MRYWAYINNEILGPFEKDKLFQLPSFTPSLLICPQTPVGEKTEDWKEAASYPEISAALTPGTAQSAPPVESPAPSAVSADISTPAQPSQDLKSLTPSPVETVPPRESNFGGITLEVNHLERSGRLPSGPEQITQSAPGFDPVSISSITNKSDAIAATGPEISNRGPGTSNDKDSQQPNPMTPEPAQPVVSDPFPQPAAAAAPQDNSGLENLNRKLEALAQSAVSRQDITELTAPLQTKLEQMGEALFAIKNSQMQREIMDKLIFLENSVVELKASIKEKTAAPQEQPPMVFERTQDIVFGAQPLVQEEKAKPAPVSNAKTTIIVDQGKKNSIIGAVIKKFFRFMLTLLLLTSVLIIAAIGLKIAGVFDFDKYLPFPLPPFIAQLIPPAPAPAADNQAAQAAPAQETQPELPKEPDSSPEVIYFARYYKASPNGVKLEDKIAEIAAAAGGSYRPDSWQAKKSGPDMYEASAVISAKQGDITFSYIVDYAKKTLLPGNPSGKAAFDALTKTAAAQAKKPGRRTKNKNIRGTATPVPAAAPAPKAAAKPAAAKTSAGADDEYEYVYEEE